MSDIDLDKNLRLELPEPSAAGLQEVIAEVAETRLALRELLGVELRKLDPQEQEAARMLAIKEAVIIWVLEKVLPPKVIGLDWDKRVEAETVRPQGLHMTRDEIMEHLRFEKELERFINDGGDEPATSQ